MAREEKTVANNKKARHDYFIEETMEAGHRAHRYRGQVAARERGAAARQLRHGQARTSCGSTGSTSRPTATGIAPTSTPTGRASCCCTRRRSATSSARPRRRGYTLVPSAAVLRANNLVKVELGLVRGKKLYDKRDAIAERDQTRDVERALRERTKGERSRSRVGTVQRASSDGPAVIHPNGIGGTLTARIRLKDVTRSHSWGRLVSTRRSRGEKQAEVALPR